jgi:hypothetical protein
MSGEGMDEDNPYAKPKVDPEWQSAPSRSRFGTLLIWGSPTLICPLIFLFLAAIWPFALVLIVLFLLWMGTLAAEQQIENAVRMDRLPPSKKGSLFLYFILQIVWIPLFYIGLFWAVCSVIQL